MACRLEDVEMKVAREPAMALVEKERVRLQITMQVEDFLRSGGEINVLKNEANPCVPASAAAGMTWMSLYRALNNS